MQIVNYDKFKNCDGCFQNHQIGTILPNSFVKFFIENWMLVLKIAKYEFNLFHPIGAFHIETNDLFCFLGWNSQSKPSYSNLRQTHTHQTNEFQRRSPVSEISTSDRPFPFFWFGFSKLTEHYLLFFPNVHIKSMTLYLNTVFGRSGKRYKPATQETSSPFHVINWLCSQ